MPRWHQSDSSSRYFNLSKSVFKNALPFNARSYEASAGLPFTGLLATFASVYETARCVYTESASDFYNSYFSISNTYFEYFFRSIDDNKC